MKNFSWKSLLPHATAVVIFLLVATIYCKPALEGKILQQHDNLGWRGMAQQSFEFREKYGHYPLWTNSMFGGMPAYQIAMESQYSLSNVYLSYLFAFGLPKPINFFFLACFSFYILLFVMRVNPWIGIVGAIAYAYSTYDPIITAVGHDTKMLAIGYAPLVIGGLLLIYKRKYWIGAALLTTGFALQASTSHLQIVYYTLLMAAAITVSFVTVSVKKKEKRHVLKGIGIAVICGLIAFASNAINLLPTYEYSKESIRGGLSELKNDNSKNVTQGGLDKEYAFRWSYGISETFTLLVPGIYGGSNSGDEFKQSTFADKLVELGYSDDTALQYANGSAYWGDQPFTSGPVYVGAIICLLTIAGIFILKDWNKWWLITISIFAILLAWGRNFESLNYFLFDYLPLYKKFRAPAMSLVIVQFCFPLLAALTLQEILFGNIERVVLLKQLKTAAFTVGIIALILIVCYLSFSYSAPETQMSGGDKRLQENLAGSMIQQLSKNNPSNTNIQQQAAEFGKSFVAAIQQDRKSLYGSNLLRSLVLMSFAGSLIFMFVKGKVKPTVVIIGILILTTYDLLSIDGKYLNDKNFVDAESNENAFTPTAADLEISKDNGYYRVFDQTADAFNESVTSYFHNSIGGYHPAKLALYNDIIEHQLSKGNIQVFNMLNTKYFIVTNPQNNQPLAQQNPFTFGPCWLVKNIKFVPDANKEMSALDSTNLKDTGIIQEKFKTQVNTSLQPDSSAYIKLLSNTNDTIRYESSAKTNQFAVFSEIYYPEGWNAYIDGKAADYIKTNYVLRGMSIPAGKHTIEFIFAPAIYYTSDKISFWGCVLLYSMLLITVVLYFKDSKQTKPIKPIKIKTPV